MGSSHQRLSPDLPPSSGVTGTNVQALGPRLLPLVKTPGCELCQSERTLRRGILSQRAARAPGFVLASPRGAQSEAEATCTRASSCCGLGLWGLGSWVGRRPRRQHHAL